MHTRQRNHARFEIMFQGQPLPSLARVPALRQNPPGQNSRRRRTPRGHVPRPSLDNSSPRDGRISRRCSRTICMGSALESARRAMDGRKIAIDLQSSYQHHSPLRLRFRGRRVSPVAVRHLRQRSPCGGLHFQAGTIPAARRSSRSNLWHSRPALAAPSPCASRASRCSRRARVRS